MWPRCRTINRNLVLLVFCLSVYTFLRGAFISYELIRENDAKLHEFSHNVSLSTTGASYPPPCPFDYLGVPPSLCGDNPGSCLNITCHSLLHGNASDTSKTSVYEKVKTHMKQNKLKRISDADYVQMTSSCDEFIRTRGYTTKTLTTEEAEFPIAYNILVHKDTELFERLLRAIYHPQNSYCVHVDANSAANFQKVIQGITGCFHNVFLASKLEHVVYAGYSRLQADINCMKDHLERGIKWKYLMNLAGQAFPLKTNAELVKILKIYNGVNDIEGIYGPRVHRSRFENEYIEVNNKSLKKSGGKNPRPPHDIDIVRGSAYGVFSREFVHYIIHDEYAVDLLKWSEKTYSPDEHYWATLHHTYTNPHLNVPGSYSGNPNKKPWLAVYVKWGGVDKCYGVWKRGVCVFGVADLPDLRVRHEIFSNKFFLDIQPVALDCLEAYIHHKTFCPSPIDQNFYSELPFVKQLSTSWF